MCNGLDGEKDSALWCWLGEALLLVCKQCLVASPVKPHQDGGICGGSHALEPAPEVLLRLFQILQASEQLDHWIEGSSAGNRKRVQLERPAPVQMCRYLGGKDPKPANGVCA